MSREIAILRITEKEYPEFAKLLEYRRTGRDDDDADTDAYADRGLQEFLKRYSVLNSDSFFIFAARQGSRYVGYISAILIPKPDPRRGVLYVDELWTAPPYRRQDVASRLMEKVIAIARELDLWRVRLYVGVDNPAARDFYKRAGFTEKDTCRFCEIDLK